MSALLTAKPQCCLNTYALPWLYLRKAEKGPDLGLNMKGPSRRELPGRDCLRWGVAAYQALPPSLPPLWPPAVAVYGTGRASALADETEAEGSRSTRALPFSQACVSFLCEMPRDTLGHCEHEVTC